jgi:hypothetical protein
MVGCEEGGKLNEPGGSLSGQDLDDRVPTVPAAQSGQRFKHGVIGFLAPIPLDTLAPRDANIGRLGRCPIDERVGDRRLADAGFSGDENDLPFTVQHPSEPLVKLAEQAIAPYEDLGASRRRSGPRRRALRDGGDEPVPPSGQRLDEHGLSRVVPENGSNLGDVALQNLRLNVRLWPEGFEDLVVGHESPGVLDEILQHGKGLGCDKNALLGRAITTPEALVDGIEPERRKLSHRRTT